MVLCAAKEAECFANNRLTNQKTVALDKFDETPPHSRAHAMECVLTSAGINYAHNATASFAVRLNIPDIPLLLCVLCVRTMRACVSKLISRKPSKLERLFACSHIRIHTDTHTSAQTHIRLNPPSRAFRSVEDSLPLSLSLCARLISNGRTSAHQLWCTEQHIYCARTIHCMCVDRSFFCALLS